jgi:hypothetical protein
VAYFDRSNPSETKIVDIAFSMEIAREIEERLNLNREAALKDLPKRVSYRVRPAVVELLDGEG